MAKIIVVHGKPGSGKTTQSKRLASLSTPELRIVHVSAGETIRAIRTGGLASRYTPNRINHPDMDESEKHRVVNDIMFEHVDREGAGAVVLVDGYPRYEGGLRLFLGALADGNHTLLGCINMEIDLQTCIFRVTERGSRRGERITVSYENIAERYRAHESEVGKTVDVFRYLTVVKDINAAGDTEQVWELFRTAASELFDSGRLGAVARYY